MTKRTAVILVLVICLLAAIPAMAADVFKFTDQAITVYADETVQPAIEQDGRFAEGTLVFKSASTKVFTVDGSGTITGVAPGSANLTVELQQDGKTVRKATARVTVLRRVTKITTNTTNLQVYEPDDPTILPLLKPVEDPENPGTYLPYTNRILVLAAGKSTRLAATITPADVRNKNYTVASSDLGVVKVSGATLTALQAGECDVTIASQQNPEITEVFHVLVTQPVKRLQISAPAKTVSVGGYLQLSAVATPDNATIQTVEWSSRNEKAASVDSNGVVTGNARGNVTIEARATDGSGVKASITLAVTQDANEITIKETDVTVATAKEWTSVLEASDGPAGQREQQESGVEFVRRIHRHRAQRRDHRCESRRMYRYLRQRVQSGGVRQHPGTRDPAGDPDQRAEPQGPLLQRG